MKLPAGGSDRAEGREALERRARSLFDDSVAQLDARTRSRLTQARHAALDEIKKGAGTWRAVRAPVGALAAATLVTLVALLWPPASTPPGPSLLPADDFEIVADADNLEMLQDVEFYTWLAER